MSTNLRGWLAFIALWMVTLAALRAITGVRFALWQIVLIAILLPAWRIAADAIERRWPAS